MIDEESKKNSLLRIARHLILNASFMDNLGLFHGKMGIVIFFAHYARYTGESIYSDFAGELLDEIYDEMRDKIPISLENGLCGIGWGILYLLENNFMEGEANEILSDIDQKIMEWNLLKITDKSIKAGVEGVGYYIEKRVDLANCAGKKVLFDQEYLSDWEIAKRQQIFSCDKNILDVILEKLSAEDLVVKSELGLENGSAGYALKQLLS